MFKNFTLFKRLEIKSPNHPTHDLVASDEKYENKTNVGSAWIRVTQDKNGNDYKFISGTLSKARTHEGKDYDGYVIISEKEWNEYQSLKNSKQEPVEVKTGGYTGEVANLDEVDF